MINKKILFIDDSFPSVCINSQQDIIQSLNHLDQHFQNVLALIKDKVAVLSEKFWQFHIRNVVYSFLVTS